MDVEINLVPILIDQELYDEFRELSKKRQRDAGEEISIALKNHLESAKNKPTINTLDYKH